MSVMYPSRCPYCGACWQESSDISPKWCPSCDANLRLMWNGDSPENRRKRPRSSSETPSGGPATDIARYREACFSVWRARAFYYCLGLCDIEDAEYDDLEDFIKSLEMATPAITHPNTPTLHPGSDTLEDYPRSVQRAVWAHIGDT